jgi:hypothetical protein
MPRRGAHLRKVPRPRRRARVAVSVAIVVAAGAAAGGVLATQGSRPARVRRKSPTTTTTTTTTTHTVSARCPLTDLPAPGGVPDRPALGVKIGNQPEGARPQSGLDEADIVYDTPAEGFVMRYLAVYQCTNAASIGPTRSLRWVDWHLMAAFGHPILAFAGGINPDVDTVMALGWLHPADLLEGAQGAAERTTTRVPPDNLYTSTSALYALFPSAKGAPAPVFSYTSGLPASARAASSLAIDFSYGTDVVWKWDAAAHLWDHTYSGVPDTDALTGKPVTTTNIVLQVVHYSFGPYIESPGSTGDVESQTVGTGSGYVLRGGRAIAVTWHRPTLSDPTTFTDASGQDVGLAPGRTWVELVPYGTSFTVGYVAKS